MFTRDQQKALGLVFHQGTFKRTASTAEAVFMITGMTIGAGILGVPYVVAQVGLWPGVSLIALLGLVMLALNLMIGKVAAASGENMQLPGLAGRYIGRIAKDLVSITLICRSYGALLAYLIGEGLALTALFGGKASHWSIIFWSVGSFLILGGLARVKKAEKILSSLVIFCIVLLSLYLLPYFSTTSAPPTDLTQVFASLGVIIFALSSTPAIGEAHALLQQDTVRFRRALIIGTLVPVLVYILFTIAVVGALGSSVGEVATIALGSRFGSIVLALGNIFAILAMCTGFMGVGTALKETFTWDHHLSDHAASFLVIAVPFLLFLTGFSHFITILGVVGGVFISLESLVMLLVYVSMRRAQGTAHLTSWLAPAITALVFFSVGVCTVWQFMGA